MHYEAQSGSAIMGLDFAVVEDVVVFDDGEVLKELDVQIIDDNVPELAEVFTLRSVYNRTLELLPK